MTFVAIRADASKEIGTGHFMRCLTLADSLKQRGATIRFISRYLPEYLRDILAKKGYEFILIDGVGNDSLPDGLAHSHWLGVSQAQDARDSIRVLSDRIWDWIVVDHYALDARWESRLRKVAKKVFVVDDLADREHDCDALLDQGLYENMGSRYKDKVPAHCRLLLGPQYILLREEFRCERDAIRVRCGAVERLLVSFGGIDADNLTGRVLDALSSRGECDSLKVDVVIGASHPFREQIVSKCLALGFSCYVQTDRMAKLMASADLAVGASGFTSFEFISMLLPAILIPVTDIQAELARSLSDKGVAYALRYKEDIVEEIETALTKLFESSCKRTAMSLACRDFMDADGVERVSNEIMENRRG